MRCPKCRFDNPKGSRFCNQCGTPLITLLEKDKLLSMAQDHIPKGLKEKILQARLGGERKNVTVLFADITGFTTLSEKLDPEEVTELINKCFESLIDVIYRYEGTIDKFIGDCIMALFGAPITHEDDPERAVYAAINIMSALDHFNEKQKTKLSIHIGINSGVVIAGGVGSDLRMDYTVMGDTVNLAERLMEQAKDEILVSKSVYRKTAYLFEMSELSPVKVKGKTGKIKSFRVIGIKKTPKRKRGIPELYSPLIGRDKEFKAMRDIFNELIQGKGSVISLIGEAGLGKSRLTEEFRKTIDGKVEWLNGRCQSYGKIIPFQVFITQIRSYFEIGEFDTKLEARKKLKNKMKILFKNKLNDYFPYLCLFLSLDVPESLHAKVRYLEPEPLQLEVFLSIKILFTMITKNKPLVLYFEDIHWIDPESVELIKFLFEGLKNKPILFLLETRPEKNTGFYKIRKVIQEVFKRRYKEIELKPLSRDNTCNLIYNLLRIPGFPKDISTLILEKSEGNPFYIEEIIRSFIDAGFLIKKRNMWVLEKDITPFEVPDTIEAVIRSRFDRMPLNAKAVLGKASVIGKSFPVKILSHICGKDKLAHTLNVLEEHKFIIRRVRKTTVTQTLTVSSQFRLGPEYQFKHTLIRDIVYEGLLKKERKEIHKKIAEYMENILGEKIENNYEILAYHYYYAEVFEKSYNYYIKAANAAKELYMNDTAISCYSKAIEIHKRIFPKKQEKIAELYEKSGDVKVIIAEYDDALEDYEDGFKNYKKLEQKANIKRKVGNILFNKGKYNDAILLYKTAIRMLKSFPSSPVLSESLIDYAWLLSVSRSEYPTAEKVTKEALTKISKVKYPKIYAQGLNTIGGILYKKGNYNKALEYYKETLKIYETLNDKKHIAVSFNNIGSVYFYKGELNTALRYSKKSLAISKEIGDKQGISRASGNIGDIYKSKGEFDTALKYSKEDLYISEEIGDKQGICRAYRYIGGIYYEKGDLDTALKYSKKNLESSIEIDNKVGICLAYSNIGGIYYEKGELDTALKYNRDCLAISEEIGYRVGINISYFRIGIINYNKGEYEEAIRYLNKHLSLSEEMGDKRMIARAYIHFGAVYRELKDFDKSIIYLIKAEKLLKEINDKVNLVEVYTNLSELNGDMKNYEKSLKLSEKALNLAEESGAKVLEIYALRAIGKALFKLSKKQIKDRHKTTEIRPKTVKKVNRKQRKELTVKQNLEKAILYLKESISLAEKRKMKLEIAKSFYELAKILKKMKRNKEAEWHLKEAKKVFKKTGAARWLSRCIWQRI